MLDIAVQKFYFFELFVLPYIRVLPAVVCESLWKVWFHAFVCSTGHLPDHPSERDPVADGAEDLIASHPPGRAAQIRGKELPGAR